MAAGFSAIRPGFGSAAGLLALLLAGDAVAAEPAPLLADMCAACHGRDGRSPGSIPPLAGMDAGTLGQLLREYRDGELEATVMDRIARGLTDSEIDAVAAHYGSLAE